MPQLRHRRGAALVVDAGAGLAFPACDLAIAEAIAAARLQGMAMAGVVRSHHCGVVVDHLRAVAAAGMVGLGLANSPAAMPAACLLYTSDAADERSSVDLGGRRIIKKKKHVDIDVETVSALTTPNRVSHCHQTD